MTSGNRSGEPQCTDNDDARSRLTGIADFALMHNRDIVNRIDDSVARVDLGKPRILRRARGYAPSAIKLPKGFKTGPGILSFGAELKNTFCMVRGEDAILSQHMGDLENMATHKDVAHNLDLYLHLYDHTPDLVAVDMHPDYLSTKQGRMLAAERQLPVADIQHHHAHIAACMAENGWPADGRPVLGVALDGLGFGTDGTLWGGEFMAADYESFTRLGTLKPVPLIGGSAAVKTPWRNAYAHLMAEMGWGEFAMNFGHLPLAGKMRALPIDTLNAMVESGTNSPLSTSCGRLFDAAAAMVGLKWDAQSYEGEAAMLFEAAVDPRALEEEADDLAYPFTIPLLGGTGLPYIEPLGVWRALLGDLHVGTPIGVIAARFHRGLAKAVAQMVQRIAAPAEHDEDAPRQYDTIALSGGCFQNQTLFELVHQTLDQLDFKILSHKQVPPNDGGIALGQAVIALKLMEQATGGKTPQQTRKGGA